MATNKNALVRYKALDNCFRNTGKRYFIEDLIADCDKVLLDMDPMSNGISRRQIFEDIAFMESKEGWQIELAKFREGKRMYYRYADASFSINNMPLNEIEITQLRTIFDILSQFKGMPQFEWVNELLPKLKQGLNSNEASTIIMEFESNHYLKGIEHLGNLYNAVFYKKVLLISYQPFENETPFEVIIHPYFLKQYNNRWFLFGFNPLNEKYNWNLAMDRILNIKELKCKYQDNIVINWDTYFEDIIGVTKTTDGELESVVLHFIGRTGKYMETKPLHESQKSKWLNKNTLEVRLKLIINYEFERLILSYADSVVVVKPIHLVTTIKQRLENGYKQY